MIRIKSKKPNFRRCGVAHPAVWTEHPAGRFSNAELAILKNEPTLIVEIIPDTAEKTDKAAIKVANENSKEPAKAGKKGKR